MPAPERNAPFGERRADRDGFDGVENAIAVRRLLNRMTVMMEVIIAFLILFSIILLT